MTTGESTQPGKPDKRTEENSSSKSQEDWANNFMKAVVKGIEAATEKITATTAKGQEKEVTKQEVKKEERRLPKVKAVAGKVVRHADRRLFFLFGAVFLTLFRIGTLTQDYFGSPAFFTYFILSAVLIGVTFNFEFVERGKVIAISLVAFLYWFLPFFTTLFNQVLGINVIIFDPVFVPLWILASFFVFNYPKVLSPFVMAGYSFFFIFLVLGPIFSPALFISSFGDVEFDTALDQAAEGLNDQGSSFVSSFKQTLTDVFNRGAGPFAPRPSTPTRRYGHFLSTSLGGASLNSPTSPTPDFTINAIIQEYEPVAPVTYFSSITCSSDKETEDDVVPEGESTTVPIEHTPLASTVISCPLNELAEGSQDIMLRAAYNFTTRSTLRSYWMPIEEWTQYNSSDARRRACGSPPSSTTSNKGFSREREALSPPPLTVDFTQMLTPFAVGANVPFGFRVTRQHEGEVDSIEALNIRIPSTLELSNTNVGTRSCPLTFDNVEKVYTLDTALFGSFVENALNDDGSHIFLCELLQSTTNDQLVTACSIADFTVNIDYTFAVETQHKVRVQSQEDEN